MSAFQLLPYYTFDDYLGWEGRWELINGIPYAMSPMPSPSHQLIAGKVHSLLLELLRKNKNCVCKVYQPIDLKISQHTVVNPDVLIVCKPITKQFLDFPPALVVEIISPSTEMKDRYTKFQMYEEFGIPYYIIIYPESEEVEVYALDKSYKYILQKDPNKSLQFHEQCSITPDWKEIFKD